MKRLGSRQTGSASKLIDRRVKELGDWRGKALQRLREIIKEADPDIVEEWKWETLAWSYDGLVCTGETYKNIVKMTFPKGASLKDPSHLFNSSLEGKVRRAIDIREGDKINEAALKGLIRAAVALNLGSKIPSAAAKPALLAGGNPRLQRPTETPPCTLTSRPCRAGAKPDNELQLVVVLQVAIRKLLYHRRIHAVSASGRRQDCRLCACGLLHD